MGVLLVAAKMLMPAPADVRARVAEHVDAPCATGESRAGRAVAACTCA